MRSWGLTCVSLAVAMAFSGAAPAALVCTPGDVLGPGHCAEAVSIGLLATTEFNSQALSFDRWQSNAAPARGFQIAQKEKLVRRSLTSFSDSVLLQGPRRYLARSVIFPVTAAAAPLPLGRAPLWALDARGMASAAAATSMAIMVRGTGGS